MSSARRLLDFGALDAQLISMKLPHARDRSSSFFVERVNGCSSSIFGDCSD